MESRQHFTCGLRHIASLAPSISPSFTHSLTHIQAHSLSLSLSFFISLPLSALPVVSRSFLPLTLSSSSSSSSPLFRLLLPCRCSLFPRPLSQVSFYVALANIPGNLFAFWGVDWLGRRKTLLVSMLASAASVFSILEIHSTTGAQTDRETERERDSERGVGGKWKRWMGKVGGQESQMKKRNKNKNVHPTLSLVRAVTFHQAH